MKYIFTIMLGGLFVFGSLNAQQTTPKQATSARVAEESSSREALLLDNATNNLDASSWERDVYRIINSNNEQNSAIFYPRMSTETQVSFFSLLFNLVKDGKVEASRFTLDNTDDNKYEPLNVKEMMDVNKIPYTESRSGVFAVSQYDIPSNEVQSYYVKERWFFDTKTGRGGVRIIAICPVLHVRENFDFKDSPVLKNPLFWVSFDAISPYLIRTSAQSNNADLNKVGKISFYDLFRNRYYKGDIYQIGNRNLTQYCPTPDALFKEQDRLDAELAKIETRFNKFK